MKKYPGGKLNEQDEGQLAVSIFVEKDAVVVGFGKKVSWIGFGQPDLRAFIDALETRYKQLWPKE